MSLGTEPLSFADWNAQVDRSLRALGSPKGVNEIELRARTNAYRMGMPPDQFASLPNLPFIIRNPRRVQAVRVVLWSIVAVGILIVLAGLVVYSGIAMKPETNSQVQRIANTPGLTLEADVVEICDAYKQNPISANERYGNREVSVVGLILEVRESPLSVLIVDPSYPDDLHRVMRCVFDGDARGNIAKLRSGDQVRLIGLLSGNSSVEAPVLRYSRIQ